MPIKSGFLRTLNGILGVPPRNWKEIGLSFSTKIYGIKKADWIQSAFSKVQHKSSNSRVCAKGMDYFGFDFLPPKNVPRARMEFDCSDERVCTPTTKSPSSDNRSTFPFTVLYLAPVRGS